MSIALCGITGGVGFDCEKAKSSQGGFLPVFYLFNVQDLDTTQGDNGLIIDSDGYVVDFAFKTYKGLYEFSTPLNTLGARSNGAQNGEGILSYTHEVDFLVYATTPADIQAIEDLGRAQQLGAIVQRRNLQWCLYGGVAGMKVGDNFNEDLGKWATNGS